MEGVTSEMRRILDIDKLQENRGKRQRRIKNDPARRKQYAFKRNQDIGGLLGLGDRV